MMKRIVGGDTQDVFNRTASPARPGADGRSDGGQSKEAWRRPTLNSMSAEDDDLYGDLATVTVKPATTAQLTFASKQSPVTPAEVGDLQQQVASLKEENETLKRNMGILFRTAKAELERKDKVIDRLQNELDGMKR